MLRGVRGLCMEEWERVRRGSLRDAAAGRSVPARENSVRFTLPSGLRECPDNSWGASERGDGHGLPTDIVRAKRPGFHAIGLPDIGSDDCVLQLSADSLDGRRGRLFQRESAETSVFRTRKINGT